MAFTFKQLGRSLATIAGITSLLAAGMVIPAQANEAYPGYAGPDTKSYEGFFRQGQAANDSNLLYTVGGNDDDQMWVAIIDGDSHEVVNQKVFPSHRLGEKMYLSEATNEIIIGAEDTHDTSTGQARSQLWSVDAETLEVKQSIDLPESSGTRAIHPTASANTYVVQDSYARLFLVDFDSNEVTTVASPEKSAGNGYNGAVAANGQIVTLLNNLVGGGAPEVNFYDPTTFEVTDTIYLPRNGNPNESYMDFVSMPARNSMIVTTDYGFIYEIDLDTKETREISLNNLSGTQMSSSWESAVAIDDNRIAVSSLYGFTIVDLSSEDPSAKGQVVFSSSGSSHDIVYLNNGSLAVLNTWSNEIDWVRPVYIPEDSVKDQFGNIGDKVKFTLEGYDYLYYSSYYGEKDENGNRPTMNNYTMQWQSSDDGGQTWTDKGQSPWTSVTTTVSSKNLGQMWRVHWISDFWGTEGYSNAGTIRALALDEATADISGETRVGQTLTASVTGWTDETDISYDWYAASDASGTDAELIATTDGNTWQLPSSTVKKYVMVTARGESQGAEGTAASQYVGPITPSVERLSGETRYGSAAAVNNRFPLTGDTVFVASGQVFADALSIAPAAAKGNNQLVLTYAKDLPAETKNSILKANPENIVIVGGKNAVSDKVEKQIRNAVGSDVKISRIEGTDRYETSLKIYQTYFGEQTDGTVFLATGLIYADALAGAPVAAAADAPILLVRGQSLSPETTAAISAMKDASVDNVAVLGGKNAISSTVSSKVQKETKASMQRFDGEDRYKTAEKLAASFATPEQVWVASGTDFPDALSAAVPAAINGAPIYLVRSNCATKSTIDAINQTAFGYRFTVGGTVAVSENVHQLKTTCK